MSQPSDASGQSDHPLDVEVEMKFPVDDQAAILDRLRSLGVTWQAPIEQVDCYYNHPSRDFATTDEALRIRSEGDDNYVTYKGPRLDRLTKSRTELELPIAAGAEGARQFGQLLDSLGFRAVTSVHKRRTPGVVQHEGREVHVAADEVQEVGSFLELEIMAPQHELAAARAVLQSLASKLSLGESQRRSYLELLLMRRAT